MPAESFELSPGYYSAFSDAPFLWDGSGILTRVYFNLRPDQAPKAVAVLTEALNSGAVPFRLKALRDEQSYRRCDTAVLYLIGNDMAVTEPPLSRAIAELAPALRLGIPALTKPLAPGVALAEDPKAPGESYGLHRCGLIAEGLIRAFEAGRSKQQDRLAEVLEVLASHHVDLQRPYLNPGSEDVYPTLAVASANGADVPSAAGRHVEEAVLETADAVEQPPTAELLGVATDLAKRLVQSAVWHRDRCTWLGPVAAVDDQGAMAFSYGNIGPALYDGDSGIALFLSLVGAATGYAEATETALGAVRHALSVTARSPSSPSLYTGTLGVILAAATVAKITHNAVLAAEAQVALDVAARSDHAGFDLLSGAAGTVVGFLTLASLLDNAGLIDHAVRAGDLLVDSASHSQNGWSWSDGIGKHPDLTGLSHGAAGAGYAFVELFHATSDSRWWNAAEQAFRYERGWFDPSAGNWPDLRDHPGTPATRAPLAFLTQWCHGAPGIALTRMRGADLTGDDTLRQEAMLALETTVRDTNVALKTRSLSFSLCHGLAGNADILLDGMPLFNQVDAAARDLLASIARTGRDRHANGDEPWPCGIPLPGRETPGLMTGLAGIGYHYLRLAAPQVVPSLLLLRPEDFSANINTVADLLRGSSTRINQLAQPKPAATTAVLH
jgi:hypothetical protein